MLKSGIQQLLNRARRRWLFVTSVASLCWALLAGAAVVLVAMWLDLLWELPPPVRIGSVLVSAGVAAVALVVLLLRGAVGLRDAWLARQFDQVGGTGGVITSGWDLERSLPANSPDITRALAEHAVGRAAEAAGQVPAANVVPTRPAGRAAGSLGALLGAVALVVVIAPGMAGTQWNRFARPWSDVPPFTPLEFDVDPGDTQVVYGQGLDIHVTTKGPQVEQLELVYRESEADESLPMFQQQDGRWRATLARVASPSQYFIRSGKSRSRQYAIDVITVPKIESVHLRITPPAYTRDAIYEGPLPKDGLAGLAGTKVEFWAKSNRPLSGGSVAISDGVATSTVSLQPRAGESNEVHGGFQIGAAGKFELRVVDVDGQKSQDSLSGSIVLLADQRPLVRLLEPRPISLATPNTNLPVAIAAEDDYGVARVQLYRSINHSRATPLELPVASPPSRRYHERHYLPLASYSLEAGDEIKLFARVEDNDPAGAKGTESQVVTIRIISQEEFERMVRVREGIQVLMSKYQQAERRMESLLSKIEELQKELEGLPDDSKLAEEKRAEIGKLVAEMRKQADDIAAASKHLLPYDIDKNMTKHLEKLADDLDKAAASLEEVEKKDGSTTLEATEALKRLAKRLRLDREEYREQATKPLAHLDKVFPLLQDQARFIQLAAAQRDLAERLAALKDEANAADPAVKARMRDLEEEQRGLREELDKLTRDIEAHVVQLPSDPEFDKLRQTALAFVSELINSGATEAMTEAEEALGQFSGSRAHPAAVKAADILEKFIATGKCDGLEGDCESCLGFQPSLKQGMGNSIKQLLGEMGLGSGSGGSGSGIGPGSGSGYGAMRGGNGYGLYGGLPGMIGMPGGGFGGSRDSFTGEGGSLGSEGPGDPALFAPGASDAAIGGSQPTIPAKYRRRVGKYFQRITEETE